MNRAMQRANLKMMRAQSAADARDGVPANAVSSFGGTASLAVEPPR